MSDFVPFSPTPANLDKHAVGRVVGMNGVGRLLKEAAHLLSYCTQPIAGLLLPKHTVSPASLILGYTRNPGVDVVKLSVELWPGNGTSTFTTTLVPSSGALRFMYPGEPGSPSPFHGASAAMAPPSAVLARPVLHEEFISVKDLTIGALTDLTLANTTNAGAPNGFRRVSLGEIPNGATNVAASPTTEVGLVAAWAAAGNPIDSDTLTSPAGFARLLRELERARNANQRQFNLCWWENSTGAISRTNTAFGKFAYPSLTNSPNFKMRVRRLLETTVPSPHEGAWRYMVTGGGTAELRLKIDGTVVQTWTGLTSGAFAQTAFKDFDVPCNTPNQFVRWSLEGKSTAGTLRVSRFYGREKF